jgi:hypothetical protein
MILCIIATVSGCGATNQSELKNSLEFEGFPSYKIDSPINDKIEVVVPIGKGTTLETMQFETSEDNKSTSLSNLKTKTNWNIDSDKEQITITLNTVTELSAPEAQNLRFEVGEKLITNTKGENLGYQADFKKLESEISPEAKETFYQVQPQWITQEYHLDEIGKWITTGYQIRPSVIRKDLFQDLLGVEMSSKMDTFEVVEGYGKYNNRSVVVTSYTVNKTFPIDNSTMEIKGKGYNLYDAKSFIHVFGDFLILVNVLDADGKTYKMKIQRKHFCDDYSVKGLIRAK